MVVSDHAGVPKFPPIPGCYAIFLDKELVYIGSTENMSLRMRAYQLRGSTVGEGGTTCWGMFRKVEVRFVDSVRLGDWAMREYRLIRRLRPPFNVRSLGIRRQREPIRARRLDAPEITHRTRRAS